MLAKTSLRLSFPQFNLGDTATHVTLSQQWRVVTESELLDRKFEPRTRIITTKKESG